MIYFILSVNF